MCNFVRRKAIIMAQKEYKDELKLDAFPEEVTEGGIRIYGETSYENQIATLSHYLHNTDFEGTHIEVQERRNEMMALIREYLEHKNQLQYYSDEDIAFAAENPFELDMFREFYEVPFPSPKHYEHTFIDLFAGIGGIRIPFDEMGYHCVFSSEWDAKACQTYFANFGTVPFGDITKIPAERIPKHDVLLAGFPCQAFSIMGKM